MYSPVQVIPKFLNYLNLRNEENESIKYLVNIKGGWEKWLQLEFSNMMRINWRKNATEIHLGERERCDIGINLKWTITNSEYLFIELKCMTTNQNYNDVVKGMKDDIIKISKSKCIPMDYKFVVGFFVVDHLDYDPYGTEWENWNVIRNASLEKQSLENSWKEIIENDRTLSKLYEKPKFQGLMFTRDFGIATICAQVNSQKEDGNEIPMEIESE